MSSELYRSLFCVVPNPEHNYVYKHSEDGSVVVDENGDKVVLTDEPTTLTGMSPEGMCSFVVKAFCGDTDKYTAWCAYCVSADGLHHLHCVFEGVGDTKFRFSAIQKIFGKKIHIEPTRGKKTDVEDYINKQGKFEEKGEIVVAQYKHGEVKGAQGKRSDLDAIEELIASGLTPSEIFKTKFSYRKYDKMVKDAYFRKRYDETPRVRDVKVVWHVGDPGSGKTYRRIELESEYGDDQVYTVTDYKSGFDFYSGEPYLILDEFRGQLPYSTLLNILDKYKVQVHARYTDVYSLWSEVHICSVLPPERVYNEMVSAFDKDIDVIGQLFRRLHSVVYHYKKGDEYLTYEISAADYSGLYNAGKNPYDELKRRARPDYYTPDLGDPVSDPAELARFRASALRAGFDV